MTLCGVELKRGEKRQIKLPFSDGAAWNAWLLCGTKPGKTLLVTAGVHGCEFVGILALQKLVETLECTDFCGQIVALPLVNPEGFFAGVKQVNPTDGKNLNREFPGKEDGTETQKMAWMMENVLYSEADFLLDLHGGDWNEELTPLVFFPCGADKTIEEQTRAAAEALSVPLRVCSTARNGLYSWAAQKGIPSMLLERGGNGRWTPEEVDADYQDILRLMRHLGMITSDFYPVEQVEITKAVYEEAPGNGLWFPEICAGQAVRRNDLLGSWRSEDGQQCREFRAELDGVILYATVVLGVQKSDPLVAYGAK